MMVNEHSRRFIDGEAAGDPARIEVSALIDSELDDAAVDRVIDALLSSDDLANFWADAHRAGDWMRSEEVIGVGDGPAFLRRFSATLSTEPAIVAVRRGRSASRRFWVRTGLPGASVAAALVVVAWIAIPFGSGDDKVASKQAAGVPTVAIVQVSKPEEAAARPAGWKAVDPDRLSDYLAAHRDVTPFAYRGVPGARQASFTTPGPASSDAGASP